MLFKNVHKNVQTIKKKFKNIFISNKRFYICITIATKLFNKPYQNEKINCVHHRNAQARS